MSDAKKSAVKLVLEMIAAGGTLEHGLEAAYSSGYYDGTMDAFRDITKQDLIRPQAETKGLDQWLQSRGGCYDHD